MSAHKTGAATAERSEPQRWFMVTGLIVSPEGRPLAVGSFRPAEDLRGARLDFADELIENMGPKGFAVRELAVTELTGFRIERIEEPIAEAVAE